MNISDNDKSVLRKLAEKAAAMRNEPQRLWEWANMAVKVCSEYKILKIQIAVAGFYPFVIIHELLEK